MFLAPPEALARQQINAQLDEAGYVEQLKFLLFINKVDKQRLPPDNKLSAIPKAYGRELV